MSSKRFIAFALLCTLAAFFFGSLFCRSSVPKLISRIHPANYSDLLHSSRNVQNVSTIWHSRLNASSVTQQNVRSSSYPADLHERNILLQAQNLTRSSPFKTKWLCLIILNQAYIQLFQNWVCSLRRSGGTQVKYSSLFPHPKCLKCFRPRL
jgi:hypothetical protein